jgi:DNA-binding NtrC family response regulator
VTEAHACRGQLQAQSGSVVMVVDDDAALRWMLSQALSSNGFEVLTAANGAEALELYRENTCRVWLVVADIIMPEMDGLTAGIEMRKLDDSVHFIFMSGYDSGRIDSIAVKIEDIPRADFFQKPFVFKDMISRVKTLERHRKGVENET